MQVASADYEAEEEPEPIEPFREKNIRVFANVTSDESVGEPMEEMSVLLCDTFGDLLSTYFKSFSIEGTDMPWKAFMGDWIQDEIRRTFGISYDHRHDDCCYALVKMEKIEKSVKLGNLTDIGVKDYVQRAIENLNVSDSSEIRKFMKSYGTHYIDSHVTGNFIYQVFKFKRAGYHLLKSYIRQKNSRQHHKTTDLRTYFASYFLHQIGDIRVASGNKTIERWARKHLRDGQYLHSRPTLLRLRYNPVLVHKLNELLDNGALLGLSLKTLRPLFKDSYKAERYAEVVENDMKLWEINA
ncbi:hypothetical protein O0L34_g10443 [Tuta absoluta]|nr:hypothetical protein O0L34_g10443 [Tuta absoluta]